MRTRVAIIGAGPAGLVLAHLLYLAGVDAVVLECRTREYVERRVRAGVLEPPTAQLLRDIGVGARMDREGMAHDGFSIRFDRADHRVPLAELTGRGLTIYGQQEVIKDLIAARLAAGLPLLFDVARVELHDLTGPRPSVTFADATGAPQRLECDVIAGCDGFRGVSRGAVPAGALTAYEHAYPFAWLGVLARAAPWHEDLIYAFSDHGFALHSMRSPQISRLYLQVPTGERIEDWADEQIWDELDRRLVADGFTLTRGPLLEKGITAMRSFVVDPMRYGRLFLAGDAAHIVPPTGAKGLNLAVADVRVLARALTEYFATGRSLLLDAYSDTCLRRVWRVEHFSWWMTTMLHVVPDAGPFATRLQREQLRYTTGSTAALTSLAENYVGLPPGLA
jgi:p-hydroxybenzoate 3-monooxygenase